MRNNHDHIIHLVKTGIGVQAVADRLGIKRYQVEYVKKAHGLQGMYRKQREQKHMTPSQAELLEEYDYLGLETTERGTIICTIGDVSGDERRRITDAVKSAFERLANYKEERL